MPLREQSHPVLRLNPPPRNHPKAPPRFRIQHTLQRSRQTRITPRRHQHPRLPDRLRNAAGRIPNRRHTAGHRFKDRQRLIIRLRAANERIARRHPSRLFCTITNETNPPQRNALRQFQSPFRRLPNRNDRRLHPGQLPDRPKRVRHPLAPLLQPH